MWLTKYDLSFGKIQNPEQRPETGYDDPQALEHAPFSGKSAAKAIGQKS
jgi:hypothetical protein